MRIVTVDFETHAIERRPTYPPRPVGLAIHDGRSSFYHAWGHPEGNNCREAAAKRIASDLWNDSEVILLMHNGAFDLEVAQQWAGLKPPPVERWRDTLVEAFLDDPHTAKLGLKDLADARLGMPPDEQDLLRDWIVEHVEGATRKSWGAHIASAPAKLVGSYARGDVVRTKRLYDLLKKSRDPQMEIAYERERKLIANVILGMEQTGVPIDHERAAKMERSAGRGLEALDDWLRKRLKAPGLEIDSRNDFADALEAAKLVSAWAETPTGKRSTSAANLEIAITDPVVLSVYSLRSKWAVWHRTFLVPWSQAGDRLYVQWNAVRQSNERQTGRMVGARTGRLSSSPNMQNIPVRRPELTDDRRAYERMRAEGVECFYLPTALLKAIGPVPDIRGLLAAPKGHTLIDADYSQQELRVLAHFEAGPLRELYLANPLTDVHALALDRINRQLNTRYNRKQIKNLGFGIIYGAGLGKIAAMLNITHDEARTIKYAYLDVMPGVRKLLRVIQKSCGKGEPIYTWGGRRYYVEPPKIINNEVREFGYKMLNVLVQGSSADVTKESEIRYVEAGGEGLFATVHDENMACVPNDGVEESVRKLRTAMESIETSPAMVAEIKTGKTWSSCKLYEGGR